MIVLPSLLVPPFVLLLSLKTTQKRGTHSKTHHPFARFRGEAKTLQRGGGEKGAGSGEENPCWRSVFLERSHRSP